MKEAEFSLENFEKLEYSELTENVKRTLPGDAPFATKLVASRALLPLVSSDLVPLLYHLAFDDDERISTTARSNLDELPNSILLPVLQNAGTPGKVLGYFGLTMLDREEVGEAVALNGSTPDSVFAQMAGKCQSERLIDIFAANQSRLLRYPELIAALVKNPITPRSTADRIERFYYLQTGRHYNEDLAGPMPPEAGPSDHFETPPTDAEEVPIETREQEIYGEEDEILGDDLPPDFKIEDLLKESYEVEDQFSREFLVDPEAELSAEKRETLENRIRKMDVITKMRLGLKGNIEARNILIKSANKMIQECVIQNQQITLDEVARIARNKTMREELIRMVATNKEWTKNYVVKINLIYNPKTPLTIAMKWLSSLPKKDLEKLSKSKQIPGMLAMSARKALEAKDRYS